MSINRRFIVLVNHHIAVCHHHHRISKSWQTHTHSLRLNKLLLWHHWLSICRKTHPLLGLHKGLLRRHHLRLLKWLLHWLLIWLLHWLLKWLLWIRLLWVRLLELLLHRWLLKLLLHGRLLELLNRWLL